MKKLVRKQNSIDSIDSQSEMLNCSAIQSKKVKNSLKFMVNQFIIFYINIF